ncbi:MAG TPA: hypothetical protein VK497_05155 [Candidatus Saccharimonadales bacterium]|nr:hypothetical protein [Candidatus Saccharimonadales bacterium]
MSQKTITINGTEYDALTGLPIAKATDNHNQVDTPAVQHQETSKSHPAHAVHHQTQKSNTLNRQVVQKSAPVIQPKAQNIQRSSHITKFAAHPSGATQKPARPTMDIAHVAHPMAQKAHAQMAAKKSSDIKLAPKPSSVIKQEAITQALDNAPKAHLASKQKTSRRFSRTASVMSASIAVLLLAGYFTYLNMPHLSVRVAAAQAGINASYPEYNPDGYSLSGPIAYSQGEVDMKFASNSGPQNFSIKQSKTSWDSSAVQENYVKQKWGDDYMPYSERGLTIYAHDGNAVWVNNGILYTIEGDAPLSSSQIRSLATSL